MDGIIRKCVPAYKNQQEQLEEEKEIRDQEYSRKREQVENEPVFPLDVMLGHGLPWGW